MALAFMTILLLLMNWQEIQMPVTQQIECFVSIYNAVHNARIVDSQGKFRLNYSQACMPPGTLVHLVIKMIHKNVGIFA